MKDRKNKSSKYFISSLKMFIIDVCNDFKLGAFFASQQLFFAFIKINNNNNNN